MHQQISKKIIIYLFIYFTLVTITNTKLSNNFYKIKNFNINGLNQIETKKLYSDIKNFENINIFLFKKKDITSMIHNNKIIQEFEIFKIYPSTLKIEIKKTKFLAITKKNGVDYIITENGNLIYSKDANLKLPYVFGDIKANDFLEFKKMVNISNFEFNKIEKFYYFKSNRWDIIIQNGLILKMPMNLTIKKLNLIYEITQKNNFNDVKIIDFRQNSMLVIDE